MATRKTASTAKKRSTAKHVNAPVAKKTTKTHIVSASSTKGAAASTAALRARSFSFSRSPLLAASIGELIGTFVLAATILVTRGEPIYTMFGLVVAVLMVGALSGAYLNPALAVGAWVTRKIDWRRTLSYIVAQVLGALLALIVINAYVTAAPAPSTQAQMLGQSSATLFKANTLPKDKELAVFAGELFGTGLFAFAFASSIREKRKSLAAAFSIGGGLFVGLLIAGSAVGYVSGTSALNPAVAVSLQAVSWAWWPIAVYVIAPLIGGVIGFALYDLLRSNEDA